MFTREYLKGLELDSDIINKIMSQYGKATERTEGKIEDLEKKLSAFDGIDVEKVKGVDIIALQKKISDYETEIETLKEDTTLETLTHENKKLKEEKVLAKHGITDSEDLELYSIRLNRLVNDEKDFETVSEEYFKEHPIKNAPPPFYTGGGKAAVNTGVTKEEYNKMGYNERLELKTKFPDVVAKFTKKD